MSFSRAFKTTDPTKFDFFAFAAGLARKQFSPRPTDVPSEIALNPSVYTQPAAVGSCFEHFLPSGLAADEPDIRVEYDYFPPEPRTRDYPGFAAGADIVSVVGLSRSLTDEEIAGVYADREFLKHLEGMALEAEELGGAIAREWAEEARDVRTDPTFATAPDIFAEAE